MMIYDDLQMAHPSQLYNGIGMSPENDAFSLDNEVLEAANFAQAARICSSVCGKSNSCKKSILDCALIYQVKDQGFGSTDIGASPVFPDGLVKTKILDRDLKLPPLKFDILEIMRKNWPADEFAYQTPQLGGPQTVSDPPSEKEKNSCFRRRSALGSEKYQNLQSVILFLILVLTVSVCHIKISRRA
jgi:hypothetical protein